jgi:hypothetical protein
MIPAPLNVGSNTRGGRFAVASSGASGSDPDAGTSGVSGVGSIATSVLMEWAGPLDQQSEHVSALPGHH